jgi:hypothetical protein
MSASHNGGGFDLAAIKHANPVPDLAAQWVRLRRRRGRFTHAGPCPLCSRDPRARDDARFECDTEIWVCAACNNGGDVIALLMRRDGLSFVQAAEQLGGTRSDIVTADMARRAGAIAHRDGRPSRPPAAYDGRSDLIAAFHAGFDEAEQRVAAEAANIERERGRLFAIWRRAVHWCGTPVETYLRAARGLDVPDNARLRFLPDAAMFAAGGAVVLHRGPAMLAAITGADRFAGLHTTWIDLAQPKGKARILDHTTGEIAPAKKVRGVKQGGHIDLGGCQPQSARRMIAGEGIETVLAVYTARARAGRDLDQTCFRSAVDLGNLAGRAVAMVDHPALKDAAGGARRVPGPVPDLTAPAMTVPTQIRDLILLGDGDSEPFITRMAIQRAATRHAADGRIVRAAFAAVGSDFNDMLTGLPQ